MPNIKDIQVILTDSSSSRVPISMLTNQHATAPGVTDDAGDGYAMGSLWLDTSTLALYYCSDATVGAAVWSLTAKSVGNVIAADYTPAQTVMVSVLNQTPLPQVIGSGEFVGRPGGGNLGAVTAVQARAIIKATTPTLFSDLAADGTVSQAKQAPIAVVDKGDADATLAAADIYGAAGGIITSAPSVAHNLTLDVTAAILAAFGATVGTYFDFAVVNTGASTATLVAGDASTTLVGAVVIAANTSCMWRVLVTATATISVIRIG